MALFKNGECNVIENFDALFTFYFAVVKLRCNFAALW